jgi:hypothetical protein
MHSLLRKLANHQQSGSLSDQLRRKRFQLFLQLIAEMKGPLNIIDVGGTLSFWQKMNFLNQNNIQLTIANLHPPAITHPKITFLVMDARNMQQIEDQQFDVAFSNSVIEHVGSFEDQQLMAAEMQRIAGKVFIQTPNYYFPIEPHFLFPFFQFFPMWLKIWLVTNFNMGWFQRARTKQQAINLINGTRLMKLKELRQIFPACSIVKERFLFITKSFIVLK